MLLAFGSNGGGQLALGNTLDTHVPSLCRGPSGFPMDHPPKMIVAGGNHTLVLFPCGRLFATGSNAYGQCGLSISTGTAFSTFQEVSAPPEKGQGWDLVSAGWDFSILVSTTGGVYVCGSGSKGELGLGAGVTTTELRRMGAFAESRMALVVSGMAHSLAVLGNGQVWGWGAGRKGQLGLPAEKSVPFPKRVALGFDATAAVCGREFSFVLDAEGTRHELLGGVDRFALDKDVPGQGELRGWKTLCAAWGSIAVLMHDGSVRAWGRNDRGQLPPAELGKVQMLAMGSEHGLAVADGKMVAWGWGEHGNCGKSRDVDRGDVVGEVFVIDVEGKVGGIGAGCATSWVWVEGK